MVNTRIVVNLRRGVSGGGVVRRRPADEACPGLLARHGGGAQVHDAHDRENHHREMRGAEYWYVCEAWGVVPEHVREIGILVGEAGLAAKGLNPFRR